MDNFIKVIIGIMLISNLAFAGALYVYSNSTENIIWTQIKNLI